MSSRRSARRPADLARLRRGRLQRRALSRRSPATAARWLRAHLRPAGRRRSCRSASAPRATSSPRWPRSPASIPQPALATPTLALALVLALGRLDLPHRQARLRLRRRHARDRRRAHRRARNSASRSSASAPTAANSPARCATAAKRYGVEALITDDYLEVEARVAELQPELVLGTQMERHIAKRLGIPCAVISAPVHVQDFPARYSPQMGFEGANVLFDTWVHPLMMGLEEHLLDDVPRGLRVPRRRGAVASRRHARPAGGARAVAEPAPAAAAAGAGRPIADATGVPCWAADAEKELQQDPVLRARQGAPQHRALRRRARRGDHHRRDAVRCQSALRPLTRRPIRVVIVTMDSHLASAAERARARAARASCPGLSLTRARRRRVGRRRRPRSSAAAPTSRAATSSSRRCCSWRITSGRCCRRCRRAATHCDAMVCCHVGRRGREAHAHRPLRHGRASRAGAMALLKRLRGSARAGASTRPARSR